MGDHSGTRFRARFESALRAYEKNAGVTLAEHPLALQLQSCHTVESITTVIQGQAQAFSGPRGSDTIMTSIKSIVSILTTVSDTASLDDAVGLVRQKALMACSTALTVFYSHYLLRKQYMLALLSYLLYVPFITLIVRGYLVTSKGTRGQTA